jgi:hypothetical protein
LSNTKVIARVDAPAIKYNKYFEICEEYELSTNLIQIQTKKDGQT